MPSPGSHVVAPLRSVLADGSLPPPAVPPPGNGMSPPEY